MFKNGYLRLLMTLVGFQRLTSEDDPETIWTIPPTQSPDQLKQSLDLIKNAEFEPPVFEGSKEAADFIRRKSALPSSRRKAAFDDESDDGIDDDDEELLFPAGGPTPMPKSDALAALKNMRRRRRRDDSEEPESRHLTDEQLSAREKARREKEREKQRKIKSDLFVHDSDDESDEERDRQFFEMEEKLRQKQKETAMKELLGVRKEEGGTGAKKSKAGTSTKKRRAVDISSDSEDESESLDAARSLKNSSRIVLEESEDEEQVTDTPRSSPRVRNSEAKRVRLGTEDADVDEDMDDGPRASGPALTDVVNEDSDDEVPVARARPRKSYGGFIVDSSDEE
jgi:replication fork protection complex subunit Tof1/Swi1